jgi:hypothetical protein
MDLTTGELITAEHDIESPEPEIRLFERSALNVGQKTCDHGGPVILRSAPLFDLAAYPTQLCCFWSKYRVLCTLLLSRLTSRLLPILFHPDALPCLASYQNMIRAVTSFRHWICHFRKLYSCMRYKYSVYMSIL